MSATAEMGRKAAAQEQQPSRLEWSIATLLASEQRLLTECRTTTVEFAVLFGMVIFWRAGQNKTTNSYVIEITI